ncbi:MAG: KH domain-containing protein, partial [Clostridia bacterium]
TLTDQPERVIASEIVREKVLRILQKEIPHGVAVVTESMKERGEIIDIEVTIYCEKQSHKGIIIGKNGATLKEISTKARLDMERFFDCKINLQSWVKVKEDWRQRPQILHTMGFDKKDFD